MDDFLTGKRLVIINLIIVFYFIFIYFLNYFQIDFILLGVFRELLTLPFMFAQLVFLVLGIYFMVKEKRIYFFLLVSLVILAVCAVFTIGSFF